MLRQERQIVAVADVAMVIARGMRMRANNYCAQPKKTRPHVMQVQSGSLNQQPNHPDTHFVVSQLSVLDL